MPSLPLIIWYLLVCLGIFEASRVANFSPREALFYAVAWPVVVPIAGVVVLFLQVADWIRQAADWIRDR